MFTDYFNLLLVSSILIIELILGFIIYFYGRQKALNKSLGYTILFLVLWTLSNFLADHSLNKDVALFWTYIVFLSTTTIAVSLLNFSLIFPDEKNKTSFFLNIIITISYLSVILIILSPYFIKDIIQKDPYGITITTGFLYPVFVIFFAINVITSLSILIKKYLKSRGLQKLQIQYLFLGFFLTLLFASLSNIILPAITGNWAFSQYGPYFAIFFITITSYAIIAHHLFDIRIIIRRTVVYSVLLVFILSVYSAVIFASAAILGNPESLGTQNIIPNLIAAILIAVGFEPLRKSLTDITDKYLFKGDYDPQEVLKQLSKNLVGVLALDEALTSMMSIVTKAMRLAHAAVIIIPSNYEEGDLMRIHSVGYTTDLRSQFKFTAKDPLIQFMIVHNDIVVVEEMERRLEDEKLSASQTRRLIRKVIRIPVEAIKNVALKEKVVGEVKNLEIALLAPIFVRSRVIGILCVGPKLSGDSFNDSDLKTLEIISGQTASAIEQARLYEEDQTKSEFVSIASHELLTPTSAIEGYLSMILDEHMAQVDDKARHYLERVYSSAKRLSTLVKDLLSVSRLEAGRLKVKIEPIQIEAIIESVAEDLVPSANAKRISLNYLKTDEPLPLVLVDGEKLQEIVTNLVGNALKYTKEGSVLVTAVAKHGRAEIAVEDTGVGIRQEDLPHLFEKFYRVDNTETVGIVGSGLGLYITKSILELMCGDIRVESTEWKGSRFIVSLPLAKKSQIKEQEKVKEKATIEPE